MSCGRLEVKERPLDDDATVARILAHVTDLGNTVLAKRAAADLHMLVLAVFITAINLHY